MVKVLPGHPSMPAGSAPGDTQSNLLSLRIEILPWATACISFMDHPSKRTPNHAPSKQKNCPFTPCFSAVMGHSRSPTQRVRGPYVQRGGDKFGRKSSVTCIWVELNGQETFAKKLRDLNSRPGSAAPCSWPRHFTFLSYLSSSESIISF